ncbi:hypothetical protein Poli38472_004299 [Pythium oligandrum]|uniref:Annexin n=1 Tax=Pythium oligandrum TaxID=41045 RepID=A0A8K1CN40_PYTOL|nr:hypothetical protein Poli38472_004299 [Pythium oligandrum]|eukprot:TMW66534.1 hypothetical protein Poli38472_004299 [Pythium oligandrum]
MLAIYPRSAFDVYNKIKINYPSNIDAICEEIYKACTGMGTDEEMLIKILGPRSPNDRALISYRYKELFNTPLRDLVKGETSGDLGFLMQLICMSLPQAEAYIIHRACKGAGTSEHLLYPILVGRSDAEMNVLKKTYFEMYEEDLAVMLNAELSGDFHQIIMLALQELQIEYKSSFHTKEKVEEDAEMLYKAGEGKWGTDEGTFVKTLFSCPPQHLENVNKAYTEKHGHDIINAIQSEFGGTATDALVYFVRLTLEPFKLLTERLEASMAGLGTDEMALSSFLVRYHPYLSKIKPIFEDKHKISLRERIHGDTEGRHRELLLHVVDAPSSEGAFA